MEKERNILLIIETQKNSFSKTEKKIATFVLKNPERTAYMSLTELSDILKVSEGSIVRFSQKLDFTGFHPFKIAVAISQNHEKNSSEIVDWNQKDKLKDYVAQRNIEVIKNTRDFIDDKVLDECVDNITSAKTILLCGAAASGNTANDIYYKFMRIGLNCKISTDIHITAMMASQLGERDVLLAISQSGSTLEVVDIANLAKEKGAKVISITGYSRSPLAKFSDAVILTPIRETPFDSGALRSKISQLYILELLFSAVFLKMKKKAKNKIKETAEAVSKWIY